ncbi:MAG: methyltransferase domain-containing protein, partial [Chloroflexota bacterium]
MANDQMKRSNATTERLLRDAGISEGMVALELGCGPGEVTELVAKIVGSSGIVLAVDRSEKMLAAAQARLEGNGVNNVRFICADLNGAPDYLTDIEHASVDVITGRRVLMYLAEPAQVVAGLLLWLRQGGLVVFEEADSTLGAGRVAAMPAHEQAVAWLDEMLNTEGVDRSMGFHLPAVFSNAGLQVERIWAEAVIDGQGDQYTLGELLQLLAPRLESAGVATTSSIESLIAQIELEKDPSQGLISGMRFCAQER